MITFQLYVFFSNKQSKLNIGVKNVIAIISHEKTKDENALN